jgi:hypothetical protein
VRGKPTPWVHPFLLGADRGSDSRDFSGMTGNPLACFSGGRKRSSRIRSAAVIAAGTNKTSRNHLLSINQPFGFDSTHVVEHVLQLLGIRTNAARSDRITIRAESRNRKRLSGVQRKSRVRRNGRVIACDFAILSSDDCRCAPIPGILVPSTSLYAPLRKSPPLSATIHQLWHR